MENWNVSICHIPYSEEKGHNNNVQINLCYDFRGNVEKKDYLLGGNKISIGRLIGLEPPRTFSISSVDNVSKLVFPLLKMEFFISKNFNSLNLKNTHLLTNPENGEKVTHKLEKKRK